MPLPRAGVSQQYETDEYFAWICSYKRCFSSSGRNDKAQLGHGDTKRRDIPTVVGTLEGMNIVDAACGRNHTLFLNGE